MPRKHIFRRESGHARLSLHRTRSLWNRSWHILAGFGEKPGPLQLTGGNVTTAREEMKAVRESAPIIWFVDDERASREWFRDHHKEHFGVVTFSSRAHFLKALKRRAMRSSRISSFPPNRSIRSGMRNNFYLFTKRLRIRGLAIWNHSGRKSAANGRSMALML